MFFKLQHFSYMKSSQGLKESIRQGQVYQEKSGSHRLSELKGITMHPVLSQYQAQQLLKQSQNNRKAIRFLKLASEDFTIFFNKSYNCQYRHFQAHQF